MTWDIDVTAARAAISAARSHLASIDDVADTVTEGYASAISATVRAPKTSQVLADLAADPFLVSLASARRSVANCTDVADEVIDAYESGDLEMAAETQGRMREAAP